MSDQKRRSFRPRNQRSGGSDPEVIMVKIQMDILSPMEEETLIEIMVL